MKLFQKQMSDFGLHKPIVIGEFRQDSGAGMTIQSMFDHAYYWGYTGAWSWSAIRSNWENQKLGIAHIKNKNEQLKGGLVNFSV